MHSFVKPVNGFLLVTFVHNIPGSARLSSTLSTCQRPSINPLPATALNLLPLHFDPQILPQINILMQWLRNHTLTALNNLLLKIILLGLFLEVDLGQYGHHLMLAQC